MSKARGDGRVQLQVRIARFLRDVESPAWKRRVNLTSRNESNRRARARLHRDGDTNRVGLSSQANPSLTDNGHYWQPRCGNRSSSSRQHHARVDPRKAYRSGCGLGFSQRRSEDIPTKKTPPYHPDHTEPAEKPATARNERAEPRPPRRVSVTHDVRWHFANTSYAEDQSSEACQRVLYARLEAAELMCWARHAAHRPPRRAHNASRSQNTHRRSARVHYTLAVPLHARRPRTGREPACNQDPRPCTVWCPAPASARVRRAVRLDHADLAAGASYPAHMDPQSHYREWNRAAAGSSRDVLWQLGGG